MCLSQKSSIAVEHVGGMQERFIIRINEMRKGRFTAASSIKLSVVEDLSPRVPAISASLQHPEAHHIFQQPSCPVHAAFIGEVQLAELRASHGRVEFRSEQ